DEPAAEHHAAEDRSRGAHLDEPVAAYELALLQMLRKDGVLHRTEERRLHAAEEERAEKKREVRGHEPDRPERHDGELQRDGDGDERRLLVLVGELPRRRGEEEEGQDEEPLAEQAELTALIQGRRVSSARASCVYAPGSASIASAARCRIP